ncbi:hypothetical protein IQ260_13055, partial [Leptolyngbya cf. ectocarpi LEGE 11479]
IPTIDGFALDYDTIDRFGDLRFTQAASIEVSGEGSGNLHFQGGTIAVLEASAIISNVLEADAGGEVRVRGAESIDIIGNQTGEFPSAFFNQGELGSTGNVGNLSIEIERLQLDNGAFISNSIAGTGDGGDLTITANDVSLMDEPSRSSRYSAGLFAELLDTDERGSADRMAGTINLTVETLRVSDGSLIATGVFGPGNGGLIRIQAQDIKLIGDTSRNILPSSIIASTFADGNAGTIDIQADTLRAVEGSLISNSTFGQGNGGSITLQANEIDLIGINPINETPSSIVASTRSSGNGGTIDVQAGRLRVAEGGQIFTGTSGQGAGGSITIQANEIEWVGGGRSDDNPSGIFTATRAGADGNGGSIDLQVDTRLQIITGAQISASTEGTGNAGDIRLQANELEVK